MANIILDPRKIKAFEWVEYMCKSLSKSEEYKNKLWDSIVIDTELFEEMLYFIDNHMLLDKVKRHGYMLTDLYVFMLENHNLFNDTGKNTLYCNKDELVLDTFMCMIELCEDPQKMTIKLNEGRGMDKM